MQDLKNKMGDAMYDVVVVGAGVMGSWTAYHLAKQGKRTLLLEQFPLPHTRGSSHGQSRIIRKAYTKVFYTDMIREAYPLWAQLEAETNTQLYKKTGMLMIGEEGGEALKLAVKGLEAVNGQHERLTPAQLRMRYPMMRFAPTMGGILDEDAGILYADKCVMKTQEMFLKYGGKLHDGEKVLNIRPGSAVLVETTRGQYWARSIVLAAGSWAGQMAAALSLDLPIQICSHVGFGSPLDPDARDAGQMPVYWLEAMREFVREHFPGLQDRPSITETCIYTNTPDEDYILDTHPTWKNIVIAAGFSGHGFKMAPAVGKVLAELALGQPPSYTLDPFRISRFAKKAKL